MGFFLADMSLPKLAAHIAKELRRLHDTEVPGSREPQLWVDIAKFVEEGLSSLMEILNPSCSIYFSFLKVSDLFVFKHLWTLIVVTQTRMLCVCKCRDRLFRAQKGCLEPLSFQIVASSDVVSDCLVAASTVSFDDHQKQKMYESISFIELRQEIDALKVEIGSSHRLWHSVRF